MEYNQREWSRIEIDVRRENIAYNIKIIKTLWKLRHGEFGIRVVKGNENDPTNLFGTLEKSQETLRQWEMQQVVLNRDKMYRWAKKIEQKTDIPGEYLLGQEMINLSDFGGGGHKEYKEFFVEYEHLYDMIDELKNNEMGGVSNKELEVDEDKAKRMNLSEIESYMTNLEESVKNEFEEIVSDAMQSITVIKEYNQNIDNTLKKLLVDDFETMLFNRDRKLYRLIFFIYRKKKCGTGESVIELIRVLNDKHCVELERVGEGVLYEYIMVLRKQLKLAEATYMVATDIKKFDNEKHYKKIFD